MFQIHNNYYNYSQGNIILSINGYKKAIPLITIHIWDSLFIIKYVSMDYFVLTETKLDCFNSALNFFIKSADELICSFSVASIIFCNIER